MFSALSAWIFYTITILVVIYALIRAFFYKTLSQKISKELAVLKLTLKEAEALIKKQQVQLNRGEGHIEALMGELNALKTDLKNTKAKNTKFRFELDKNRHRIKSLEQKLESLL